VNTRMLPDVNASRKRRTKKAEPARAEAPDMEAHPVESFLYSDEAE